MYDLQLVQFLFDTIESLLVIAKDQNARLAELDAVMAADKIAAIENRYIDTVYDIGEVTQ